MAARPVGAGARLVRAGRRRPVVALLLVLLSVSLLGGLGGVTWKWREANEQRDLANSQAQQADDEKQGALYEAYRARIAAAGSALQNHDVADAARSSTAAPEDLRGWEWRHLHSRLDDSTSVISLPAGGSGFLLPGPDRLRVGTVTGDGLRLTDLEGGEPRACRSPPKARQSGRATQTRRGLRIAAWVGNTTFHLLDEAGRSRLSRGRTLRRRAQASDREPGRTPSGFRQP